ncbi:MAG: serine hydrolase domain-containing protein [Candidatus Polarisedimenticolia bacterium]
MLAFLEKQIAAGSFPGASYLIAEGARVLAAGAAGDAVVTPRPVPVTTATLYDLASLTKPLATGLLAVLLQRCGALRLDDRLSRHLPEWTGGDGRERITLLDLLTHRSGLPAWAPLYLHARRGERAGRIGYLRRMPLAGRPGTQVVYSDPGYILLGFALERAARASLDRLFRRLVARPLGLRALMFRPPATLRPRIAATERGNARERHLAGPAGDRYNGWRDGIIRGAVHDHNAFTLEGVSGHAGLFGTARAVFRLAREFLPAGRGLLEEGERRLFRSNLTGGLQEDRSVGFQIASTPGSSAGPALSRAAFGHTGFTGTSLWIDPKSRRIFILLTNRVHPEFRDMRMNSVRRAFHAIAAR